MPRWRLRRPPRNGGPGGYGGGRGRAGIRGPFVYREKPYKRLEIVFAKGLRAVTHQQGVLDSVRTRATTLTAWRLLIGDGPASHGRAGSRLASSRHPDRHAAIRNLARRRMHAPRHERLSVVVRLAACPADGCGRPRAGRSPSTRRSRSSRTTVPAPTRSRLQISAPASVVGSSGRGPVGEGDAEVTGGDICGAEVDAKPYSRVDGVGAYGPAAVVVTDGSGHGGRGQGYVEVPWTRTGRPACVLSTRRRRCSRPRSPDRAG